MTGRAARRTVIRPREQRETLPRVIPRPGYLRLSPRERVAISGLHTKHRPTLPERRTEH